MTFFPLTITVLLWGAGGFSVNPFLRASGCDQRVPPKPCFALLWTILLFIEKHHLGFEPCVVCLDRWFRAEALWIRNMLLWNFLGS